MVEQRDAGGEEERTCVAHEEEDRHAKVRGLVVAELLRAD